MNPSITYNLPEGNSAYWIVHCDGVLIGKMRHCLNGKWCSIPVASDVCPEDDASYHDTAREARDHLVEMYEFWRAPPGAGEGD